MLEHYEKYDKKQTVQFFVDNLIWGNLPINDFIFRMDNAAEFRRGLEENIIAFQKNPSEENIDRVYEAIIRLRVNGAISDKGGQVEEEISGLKADMASIVEKMAEIESRISGSTKPQSGHFKAFG